MRSTKDLFEAISSELQKLFVGQDELVLSTLVALFSGGHVLIESLPGMGKTLFVRTLGKILGCKFGRIQFTADLMPSDITGAPILDVRNQEFKFRPGPVFTQLLLADEINRSPAKTHAALLEIMQEYRVTVDGTSHILERPFLVMATQNPIESEGTYNLPEAQLDRFMFKVVVDYPDEMEEERILTLHSQQLDLNQRLDSELQTVTSPAEIQTVITSNASIRVDPQLVQYINRLVRQTRSWPSFHLGASPRAGIALMQGARTLAACRGRDYATPDDVVDIALPALRHRVIMTAEAEVEGLSVDTELRGLFRSIEVPRGTQAGASPSSISDSMVASGEPNPVPPSPPPAVLDTAAAASPMDGKPVQPDLGAPENVPAMSSLAPGCTIPQEQFGRWLNAGLIRQVPLIPGGAAAENLVYLPVQAAARKQEIDEQIRSRFSAGEQEIDYNASLQFDANNLISGVEVRAKGQAFEVNEVIPVIFPPA